MRNQSDHRYYEVTLVIAIPDYFGGTDNSYTALDAVTQALRDDAELIVLEMEQSEVYFITKPADPIIVKPVSNAVTTTTYTNTVINNGSKVAKASKPKARKKVKAKLAYKRWTDEQILYMMELHNAGVSVKEIARVTGRSASAIGNAVYQYKKGGK
jgi:hypothetical protein